MVVLIIANYLIYEHNKNKSMNEKINKIAILYDIINQYTLELVPELRHGLKHLTKEADKALTRLIKEFDKIHSEDSQEWFGIEADKLRELIDSYGKSDN